MKTTISNLVKVLILSLFLLNSSQQVEAQVFNKIKKGVKKLKNKKKDAKTKNVETGKPAEQKETEVVVEKEEKTVAKQEAPDVSKYLHKTDGISNSTHEKFMNKIVFSNSDIAFESPDESKFITDYNLGDPLFFRVYMDNSLINSLVLENPSDVPSTMETHARYKFSFFIDDAEVAWEAAQEDFIDSSAKRSWTSWKSAMVTKDGKYYMGKGIYKTFIKNGNLTEGTHKLTIKIAPYQTYPKTYTADPYVGTLNVTVKKDWLDPNDSDLCLPQSKKKDAALEQKLRLAYKEKGHSNEIGRLVITSKGWTTLRNSYSGVVLGRSIEAAIGYKKDGKCYYEMFDFDQDHDGSNYMVNATYLSGIGISTFSIPCDCLKE